ncbi:WD repeat-containing protein 89-like protein [Cucurbita argyrosperma subsp. argyrosperma]
MESIDMDVEEPVNADSSVDSSSFKRFGLKNAIQTNFGDDYVFHIAPNGDWTQMAVSLSSNVVKLYSPVTGQYYGECRGHIGTINQISFAVPSTPHVLHSCSSDGTIRSWDVRNFQQVSSISAGPSQEIFSFAYGGSSMNLLAAGCKSQILFWDWRNRKQVACLEDSHVEDVTQVHFIPGHQAKLASASVDGLVCIFDTNGDIDDDEHMDSVINVGTSVGKIGFFGEKYRKLWCLTHIETLSLWDWTDGRNEADITDARTLASNSWTMGHVDYLVDCHYSSEGDRLWVLGGTNDGTVGYFPVDHHKGKNAIESPDVVLEGGHIGIVRSVLPMTNILGGFSRSQGVFGWTGGEDGRLCCWSSDDSCETNRSWISSTLVIKSPGGRRKHRHHPY